MGHPDGWTVRSPSREIRGAGRASDQGDAHRGARGAAPAGGRRSRDGLLEREALRVREARPPEEPEQGEVVPLHLGDDALRAQAAEVPEQLVDEGAVGSAGLALERAFNVAGERPDGFGAAISEPARAAP